MNHTLSGITSLTFAQGWPSTMSKVSGLKINYVIFVMLQFLCFDVYFYCIIHNCDNLRQALNQLHAHALTLFYFR